ncbi:MAG: adenylyl-sulfate kinase [Rhodocyclales bacterium]|nr:adenylyl-sulfate kinase [Rhodocyclales bacterium]
MTTMESIHKQPHHFGKAERARALGQKPCVVWLTGLSAAGKSSIAEELQARLFDRRLHCYLLDGDIVRTGLSRDLGYSDADRQEHIRRVGEIARLFVDAGLIVLVALISPFRAERRAVRALFEPGEFIEVFVDTPLPVCEQRDPKGLYRRARAGQVPLFTGIDSPYEVPEQAEVTLPAGEIGIDECVLRLVDFLQCRGNIPVRDEP